jgi:stress response protein YsnF
VKVEDIPEYIAGLAGTSRMESMIREVYRLTGTVPDGDTMASLVQRWIDELKIQGIEEKEERDICTHFISWARIAIPAENRKGKSNITKTNLQNNEKRYYLKLPDGFKPLM